MTGRKIIVDTYGGWGAHGGGAFSGKDPTKVDRSAAYASRWVAKSLVKAEICKRVLVQVGSGARLATQVHHFSSVARGVGTFESASSQIKIYRICIENHFPGFLRYWPCQAPLCFRFPIRNLQVHRISASKDR